MSKSARRFWATIAVTMILIGAIMLAWAVYQFVETYVPWH